MTLKYRILPGDRCRQLKAILTPPCRGIRILEAHNGLSAIVASTAACVHENGHKLEFDGLWISSLTASASQGIPDSELSSIEKRLDTIQEIVNVTNKPLIVDGDTGGEAANFEYFCSRLESLGVSAIIIEDKKYPKRNSLAKTATHYLEDPDVFAQKIRRAREMLLSDSFMIFARLESLIANRGIEDALARARTYLLAGADGIMIHSKQKSTDEVYAFLQGYEVLSADLGFRKPIICVPTTYNQVTAEDLFKRGVNITIHANHLLRAAHHAMQQVSQMILQSGRSLEAESLCTPVPQLFEVVGFNDVVDRDARTYFADNDLRLEEMDALPASPSLQQIA